jgi:hypothetical protein
LASSNFNHHQIVRNSTEAFAFSPKRIFQLANRSSGLVDLVLSRHIRNYSLENTAKPSPPVTMAAEAEKDAVVAGLSEKPGSQANNDGAKENAPKSGNPYFVSRLLRFRASWVLLTIILSESLHMQAR